MNGSSEEHRYVHLSGLVFGQPLLATIEAAETVGNYLRSRIEGTEFRGSRFVGADQADPQTGRWKGYRLDGNVGIVSVLGELVNRGAWMGASSGLTSYEGLVQQVRQAAADPAVKAIVLDINSPGGEAWGAFDAAREVRLAAGGKRLVAVANAMAASAAYAIACVADEIVVNDAGLVGSIGVVTVHFDQSKRLEQAGVKATVISTGNRKMVGHSAIPLDDEGQQLLRQRAERLMAGFVALIGEHRPHLTTEALGALQGDILIGSDAVAAGLADRVGTFASVILQLQTGKTRPPMNQVQPLRKEGAAAPERNTPMSTTKPRNEAEATAAYAANPALAAEFPTVGAYVALQRYEAKKAGTPWLASPPEGGSPSPQQPPESGQEASAGAEWDASAALQSEFPNRRGYVLLKQHEARKAGH